MKKITHIGEYEIVRKIATGGMAEIYIARRSGPEGFSKHLVLKKIHSHLCTSEEFTSMFIHEAQLAAKLNHRNIVHVHDFGESDGLFFIAMEYVEGRDLKSIYRQAINRRCLIPLHLCVYVVQEVCGALHYAHHLRDGMNGTLGIVHRDISPQNVLISYAGEVKLTDFGIAQVAASDRPTDSNTLKGKIAYMSPEQSWGRELDGRSDIFSLGIVFFEILTGQRLFYGQTDVATLERVRQADIPKPSMLDPGIPEELDRIALKALSRDASLRYQNALEMKEDLQAFSVGNGYFNPALELGDFVMELFDTGKEGSETDGQTGGSPGDEFPSGRPIPVMRLKEVLKQSAVTHRPAAADQVRNRMPLVEPVPEEKPQDSLVPDTVKKTGISERPPVRPWRLLPTAVVIIATLGGLILLGVFGVTDKLYDLLNPPTATLMVRSNQPHTRVLMNGAYVGEADPSRPCVLAEIPAGEVRLAGEKHAFRGIGQTVQLDRGDHRDIMLYLMPAGDAIIVRCNQLGAHVTIDGKVMGSCNQPSAGDDWELVVNGLPAGEHWIEVSAPGFPFHWEDVRHDPDTSTVVRADLRKLSERRIVKLMEGEPGATVKINGEAAGEIRADGTFHTLLAIGKYGIEVEKDGFKPFMDIVELGEADNVRLAAHLVSTRRNGRLRLLAPPGADVSVDSRHKGRIPSSGEITLGDLDYGRHVVSLHMDGFKPATRTVTIDDDTSVIRVDRMLSEVSLVDVKIMTSPPGALICLDGGDQVLAPAIIKAVVEGEHRITARLQGYVPVDRMEMINAEHRELVLELHRQ
ncbi:PEGA domain-containing protein [bacterium]|nr:PEGA domain-containing protein [candidate division CSSED10-310 bacterium]